MNKPKKINKFKDKLELDYLDVIRRDQKLIDQLTIIDVLIQTQTIPDLASIRRTLNREINGLSYE